MPWEEKSLEETRAEFVKRAISGEATVTDLCKVYGISRTTAYKWIRRYHKGESLRDKRRTPKASPNKTPEGIEELILKTRDEHPAWGPTKLRKYLGNKGYSDLPARSTIGKILQRNNRIEIEESLSRKKYKRFERKESNELWQVDFKGYFKMLNNKQCHPLTVLDDHSRFALCIDAKENERYNGVYLSFKRLFNEFGLPVSILCDNGSPWGSSSFGYTPFEIWLMQLNILPIHGRPYHPQTQGKDERFHQTLKKELLKYHKISDIYDAQEKFDWWKDIYNYERPHEAIGLCVPSDRYTISLRTLPISLKESEYDSNANVRKVNSNGYIIINKNRLYFSESFIGKYLELKKVQPNLISLNYGDFQVAQYDLSEHLFVSRTIKRKGTYV
jgi:transposase InsO family protein